MKTTITQIILLFTLLLLMNENVFAGNPATFAPPTNDRIENAIDLNYGPLYYNDANVNFPDATFTGDGSSSGCNQVVGGIWYKFHATKNGNVSAFIQTNNGAIVTFYSADNGNVTNASQLTYVDQPSNLCAFGNLSQIDTITDTYYYIFMRNIDVSTIAINVSNTFASPENDFISMATEVSVNTPNNTYEDIHFLLATHEMDGGQNGCNTEDVPGIWYKFYSEVSMDVSALMSSDNIISSIIFYKSLNEGDAQSGSDLEHVVQTENPCGIQNTASITTEAGNWYYIFASTLEPYADVTIESMVLGVSENELEGFVYYPNPFTNEINFNAETNICEVNIFNVMGQKVYNQKINATKKNIDLSHLQSGIYIMKVTAEGSSATYKILKR